MERETALAEARKAIEARDHLGGEVERLQKESSKAAEELREAKGELEKVLCGWGESRGVDQLQRQREHASGAGGNGVVLLGAPQCAAAARSGTARCSTLCPHSH